MLELRKARLAWAASMCLGIFCIAPSAFAAPLAPRIAGCEKGSLVILPDIEVRWENVAPFRVIQDTFVHLTNDYPAAVAVKMYFLNGDAPIFSESRWDGDPFEYADQLMRERMSESRTTETRDLGQAGGGGSDNPRDHPGWNFLDNVITLTANEPAYWSAASGLPKGVSPWATLDPGPDGPGRLDPDTGERYLRGSIVAFAVQEDPVGDEIRWNHLAADATIVNYPGEWAWQYCAYTFKVSTEQWAHGEATGTPGRLSLNGGEYGQSYDELLFNFIASGSDAYSGGGREFLHDTDLTLMPVSADYRQENDGPVITKASFDIWNQNEVKFTNLDRCVSCWDQELLSRHAIPNHFLLESLHTDAGKARIDGLESFLCPESVEASLIGVVMKRLDFGAGTSAAGNNLHGMGTESAVIRYDSHDPPPESNGGPEMMLRR